MRKYLVFFFILFGLHTFSQNEPHEFFLPCNEDLVFDSALVEGATIRYKLISGKTYTSNGLSVVMGEIILPDFTRDSEKSKLLVFLKILGAKNHIEKFEAYQTCGARFISISAFVPGSNERKMVSKEVIGTFDLREKK